MLTQYAAQITIRNFIIHCLHRRRNRAGAEKSGSTTSQEDKTSQEDIAVTESKFHSVSNWKRQRIELGLSTSTSTARVPAAHHFIFRALLSNSLAVRQNASLQLIHAADNPIRMGILVEILWDIVREEMDSFFSLFHVKTQTTHTSEDGHEDEHEGGHGHGSASNEHTHGYERKRELGHGAGISLGVPKNVTMNAHSNIHTGAGMNTEGILQLYGLMSHYITGSGAIEDDSNTDSNDRFYSFLVQGGLDWLCDKILALIHLLMACGRVDPARIIGTSSTVAGSNMDETDAVAANTTGNASTIEGSDMDMRSEAHEIKDTPKTPSKGPKNAFSFASPSIHKPRHYFTTITQSNNINFPSRSEEEIKNRIYILVDFCLRITVLAGGEKLKQRHEGVLNWMWKRKSERSHGGCLSGDNIGSGNNRNISPFGCLLTASLILKKSDCVTTNNTNTSTGAESIFTGEDSVFLPDKKIDRINWMLARMVDINAEVMVVSKEKDKDKENRGHESPRTKKRKTDESSSFLPRSSSEQSRDRGDPNERFLSRMVRRQRVGASNSNSAARAIMRVVGGTRPESSRTSEGFSSAAEVMARTLSILDSDNGRDDGEESGNDLVSNSLTSSLGRLIELRSGLKERDEENIGRGNNENGDDDDCIDDDDGDGDGESKGDDNNEDEHDAHFHVEEDEEIESDVQMEEVDEDEEILSEEEEEEDEDNDEVDEADDDDDGDDEGRLLDNIIVEVGSNPFQDDHIVMVDEMENTRSMMSMQQPNNAISRHRSVTGASSQANDKCNETRSRRSKFYIRAGINIMEAHYYVHFHSYHHPSTAIKHQLHSNRNSRHCLRGNRILTPSAEHILIQSICDIVKPPKKPLKLKVYMRRAPTQEEFFRGSLAQNPIFISSLKTEQGSSSSNASDNEPRVKDLRQRIANELQMGDSAELLELLVADKILDMNLKLRVVAQNTWRDHLMENTSSINSDTTFRQFMSGSSLGEIGLLSRGQFDESTPISALPPMVVTYRLAGVDGEATEDNIAETDLLDPDAPLAISSSSQEYEKQMEKEFGITRIITKGRGVSVLLRSLEGHLSQIMKRIRRDDVGMVSNIAGKQIIRKNPSRLLFLKSPPCPSLKLLQYCAMISDNRKKLIDAQAPTVLLRLLLDVLNSIDQSPKQKRRSNTAQPTDNTPVPSNNSPPVSRISGNNPTTDALQELIETLSSDISAEITKKSLTDTGGDMEIDSDQSSDNDGSEESTLPMLLSSLRSTSLSPPLRKVIAKLLPFLTYGQVAQSRALASQFLSHIHVKSLGSNPSLHQEQNGIKKVILMETFVDAAIHLPPVAVCDTLRSELIRQGFVANVRNLILSKIPSSPPPPSSALFGKEEQLTGNQKEKKLKEWKAYYSRNGLQTAFKILIGLSTQHNGTQTYLSTGAENSNSVALITASHWIESTSDKDNFKTNGLGILAETLLDTMLYENEEVKAKIMSLRKKTRDRKKEIAQERRKKALSGMNTFGRLVGEGGNKNRSLRSIDSKSAQGNTPSNKMISKSTSPVVSRGSRSGNPAACKPSWMLEMEEMEDEVGLTCAVCQEGRNYQPSEMLGLYAFMKKVSIPHNKGGARGAADGALMLLSIPPRQLPESLSGSDADIEWYQPSLDLAALLKVSPYGASALAVSSSSVMNSRSSCSLLTTVTAGNAIHCACHARARSADRNHPKAPKTEWEGASLRNSRVSCNVILPLISKENSKVAVMSMENSLADHQQAVSNIIGTKPKSMLWIVLHDLRLLLLRISYGEALHADCGGGSISSNASLIFHFLFLAHMFARDAEHDAPVTVRHAKGLSTGYLAASSILRANDKSESSQMKKMRRGFADAGPMAAICCILFQNSINDEDVLSSMNDLAMSTEISPSSPPPKRRWEMHKDHFLHGILQCAGRRHSLGVDGSGCATQNVGRRMRSSSFSDWNDDHLNTSGRRPVGKRSGLTIEEYGRALRPMITLYAIFDQVSKAFTLNMEDDKIETCSQQIVSTIEACQQAKDIRSLISLAKITLDDTTIIEELEAGMKTV